MRVERRGGPESLTDLLQRLLAPRGSVPMDGLRLAAINTTGIMMTAVLLAIVSLLTRAVDGLVAVPFILTGFITVVVCVGLGVFVWFRYSTAHGVAVRQRRNSTRPDVFGALASVPFVLIAAFLTVTGLLGLLLGIVSFSLDRALDAARSVGLALFFLALAAGNIIVARAASD